ncbi:gephyrin-like molybdotransferase Glp [Reinekea blandensis]|nr:gephyrin-like molybdotransferase Glp [Reinekea blandensis]
MGCCDQPGLMPLNEGLEKLLAGVIPVTETESVALADAAGRVLAEDIRADSSVPGFDNSAMDGYAIRLDSIAVDQPIPVQGKSFAGAPFRQPLEPGKAVRIMTGAAIPDGADCVIMQENTLAESDTIRFLKLAEPGNNIRRAGEDIAIGDTVLTRETRLNAAHIALLAATGRERVDVFRKTRVALISTGDELKTPGVPLGFGDIYNSNGPALTTMLNRLGVELIDYGILPDDRETFVTTFLEADRACDFVITSGGVSVGEADYTKDVLEELGDIRFWKLAIKPGKPFAFGKLPNSVFIGLPGNPVSAMVTFHVLGSQAIRQHQHVGYRPMQQLKARSVDDIRKAPGRMDFQRGHWQLSETGVDVRLTRSDQGSHILTSLANANCYIALEKERGQVLSGEEVTLWLFDDLI